MISKHTNDHYEHKSQQDSQHLFQHTTDNFSNSFNYKFNKKTNLNSSHSTYQFKTFNDQLQKQNITSNIRKRNPYINLQINTSKIFANKLSSNHKPCQQNTPRFQWECNTPQIIVKKQKFTQTGLSRSSSGNNLLKSQSNKSYRKYQLNNFQKNNKNIKISRFVTRQIINIKPKIQNHDIIGRQILSKISPNKYDDYYLENISPNKLKKSQTFKQNNIYTKSHSRIKTLQRQNSPIKQFKNTYNINKKKQFNQQLNLNDFKIGQKLGEGRFGKVFKVIHRQTNSIYALKKISKKIIMDNFLIEQFILQIKIQSLLHHPNIVALYAVFDDKQHVYLIMQYLSGGSLYSLLKKKQKFSQEDVKEYIIQVTKALQAVHNIGAAHRDLKPQNIIQTNGICKLTDFGWATICDQRRMTYCGTTDYVSPQIVSGQQYGLHVDMWCLGVLTYQLLAGRPPFYHISKQQTFKKIQQVAVQFPSFFSQNAKNFIGCLLRKNPQLRLSACAALQHSFLNSQQENEN